MRSVTLLAVLLMAGPALAAPRRVILEPMFFFGNASPAEQKLLEDRVLATVELLLSERGDELVHREELAAVLAAQPELKDCHEPRCLLTLGDRLQAERILTITVNRSGSGKKPDWNVRIDQFLVAPAHFAATTELPCRACTADSLLGDLSHVLDPLLMPRAAEPLCTLSVSAAPGAVVQVDGKELGAAPFAHTVPAGRHEVAAGGKSRSLECVAGGNLQVSLAPEPVTVPPPVVRRRSPALKIIGATLLVLGAAGVAAGAVDLARNGNGTCDKAPGQKRCPQVYDTFTAGAALTGVGVAGLAAGAATLAVDALRKPRAYVSIGRDYALVTVGGEL